MSFIFNLDRVDLLTLDISGDVSESPASQPEDLYDVIGTQGDRYRDWFTRACLYLVGRSGDAPGEGGKEIVVVGTEYGNTAALLELQRAAATQGRRLSAQYFPGATSSSAAAFLSMKIGATGGNYTVNAGLLTPLTALWQALCGLRYPESSGSRLLVGDIYCAESVEDVMKETPELACESGLMHTCLTPGSEFEAQVEFDAPHDEELGSEVLIPRTYLHGPAGKAVDHYGRNGAFALSDLLRTAHRLEIGENVRMECRTLRGPCGKVTITRLAEGSSSTEGSGR
ncbi:hypothetical protein [Streptomyces tsukubensis]|uniref:Beta-ketoacyl synthase N-terminal domain-containing protein n=1 Tax=Streptomyces tsukubensis TaxID=83656 RepID=A0A1V4AC11_9ACTN|nr:hypothetical protein [Streptomyces tsukubensis]OON81416.1 hypothetical protein B1H18_08860 [Streptomyces tsukubensis]QFR95454.1 hypothetical protein GBW32_23570 [Streptomyces tsukubensis]